MPILNVGAGSFQNDLAEIFESLQRQRSAVLGALVDAQLGARLLTELEAKRLEQKDNTGDPRVQMLRRRAEAMLERIRVLMVEGEIASVRTPPVVKTGALVQGRITDAQRRAAGRVAVRLVTEKGADLPGVEPVEADDAGYFVFVLQPETVEAIDADAKVQIVLRDGQEQLAPASAKAFTIAPGLAALQEVTLSTIELEKLHLRMPTADPPTRDKASTSEKPSAGGPARPIGAGTKRGRKT